MTIVAGEEVTAVVLTGVGTVQDDDIVFIIWLEDAWLSV